MKNKIRTLIILIAIFAISLTAGIFAGCIGEQNAKERAEALGMTACVTYYVNGGYFIADSPDDKVYRTDYYYPDTPIFNIGVDQTSGQPLTIKRDGYVFAGWEYAVLDGKGLPLLYEVDSDGKQTTGLPLKVLENGTASIIGSTGRELLEQAKRFEAVPSGEKVFANGHPKVKGGEHKYLVATWAQDVVLEYKLITDAPITVQSDDGNITYNNGDTIATRGFLTSDTITLMTENEPASFSGFSYINLYWDEEGTNEVVTGEQITKNEDETNSVIYAKYLKGDWKTVRTANDAANMLRATSGNYFVVYDIDCSSASVSYRTTGSFGAVIEGNGKTLSNINISNTVQSADKGSIFGNLTRNAQIKNLTIENVNISLSLNGEMSAYVLVSNVAEGAVFENFALNNVTLNIRMSNNAKLNNIQYVNGSYEKDNWLYGAYDTDVEFESKYGNLVHNGTLIINNTEIVTGGQL